ncbi:MAG: thiamine phosphate synthase [Dehalococcoidia bacterium]|nr:thiamine phosphate synthase [Chloroflexota bacterium]MDP7674141.1 thiamine phosphate synthase [Dehalococcoidia bacterium]
MRSEIVERMRGIYVIVDPEHTNNRNVLQVAEAAFNGGASTVQLRDKISSKRTIVETATEIQQLADNAGSLFIMNDHADIARIVASDGLHVGQKDIAVEDCRVVLDDRQIIGTSNALVTEAEESERIGADYLAVGAMFPTATKIDTRPAGLETLTEIRAATSTHIVAIGGINESNLGAVLAAGADSVCIASAITKAEDVEAATRRLVKLFDKAAIS